MSSATERLGGEAYVLGDAVVRQRAPRARGMRNILQPLKDAMWLLLVVLLFPVVILVIGTPVALFVRLLVELARRL